MGKCRSAGADDRGYGGPEVLWVLLALGMFARVAEKVIDRGEKIELLVDKAEELNEQAARFKKQSNTVHYHAPTHAVLHGQTRTHAHAAFMHAVMYARTRARARMHVHACMCTHKHTCART